MVPQALVVVLAALALARAVLARMCHWSLVSELLLMGVVVRTLLRLPLPLHRSCHSLPDQRKRRPSCCELTSSVCSIFSPRFVLVG